MDLVEFLDQDLSAIKEKLTLEIVKDSENPWDGDILDVVLGQTFDKIKYVLEFCIVNRPSLIFRKKTRQPFLHSAISQRVSLEIIKPLFEFCMIHCPSLFLIEDIHGSTIPNEMWYADSPDDVNEYVLKFYDKNFPEIDSTPLDDTLDIKTFTIFNPITNLIQN
jgi:hypothetical protein